MKKTFQFLVAWLLCLAVSANPLVFLSGNPPAAGGGALYTDDFNRANGGFGANWTVQLGSNMAIVSNEARTTTAGSDQFYLYGAGTFANNQYSKMKSTANPAGLIVAVRASGAAGTFSAYWARKDGIHKHVTGSYTNLLNDDAAALAVNGVLEIRVNGTTISRYVDGVLDGSVTDSSLASGKAAFGHYSSGPQTQSDDWEGGDL